MSVPMRLVPVIGVNLYSHPLMKQFYSTCANEEQCEKVEGNSERTPVELTNFGGDNIINLFNR